MFTSKTYFVSLWTGAESDVIHAQNINRIQVQILYRKIIYYLVRWTYALFSSGFFSLFVAIIILLFIINDSDLNEMKWNEPNKPNKFVERKEKELFRFENKIGCNVRVIWDGSVCLKQAIWIWSSSHSNKEFRLMSIRLRHNQFERMSDSKDKFDSRIPFEILHIAVNGTHAESFVFRCENKRNSKSFFSPFGFLPFFLGFCPRNMYVKYASQIKTTSWSSITVSKKNDNISSHPFNLIGNEYECTLAQNNIQQTRT